MTWRTIAAIPFATLALLFAFAEGGSHLLSLNPAESLHELVYGRAPGTICVVYRIDPGEPRIAREIYPDTKFLTLELQADESRKTGEADRRLRGLPSPETETSFDLRIEAR